MKRFSMAAVLFGVCLFAFGAPLQMVGTDPEGDPLTWSCTGLPPGFTCSTTGLIDDTNADTPGAYSIQVYADDGNNPAVSIAVPWDVSQAPPPNDPPVIADPGPQSTVIPWAPPPTGGQTYTVGSGQPYATLNDLLLAVTLGPGDRVEISPGDYPEVRIRDTQCAGAPGNPVTFIGVGGRPVFENTVQWNTVHNECDHAVFDNLEITGGTIRGFYHQSHDVVIQNSLIRDTIGSGIMCSDTGSGSIVVQNTEFRNVVTGGNTSNHAIYCTSDQVNHPGSYAIIQNNWFRGPCGGGNQIKLRSEINRVYYNQVDEPCQLESIALHAPDPAGAPPTYDPDAVEEHGDIVGNLIVDDGAFAFPTRLGGDSTGCSNGRYRVVNNTFVRESGGDWRVLRLFDCIDSVEFTNNIVHCTGCSPFYIEYSVAADWFDTILKITGEANWITTGATQIPANFTGTIQGTDPGLDQFYRLVSGPALGGAVVPVSPPGYEIPWPVEWPPAYLPGIGYGSRNSANNIGHYE